MDLTQWTNLIGILAWPVTVFCILLFLRNALEGAISRLKGVEGPAGWKLLFEVRKVGERLQKLEQMTVDIYNLSGETSAVRDEIFEYVADILEKVSPQTALEMRMELNKYHIPRVGVSVADLKQMLSKLGFYQETDLGETGFSDDISPPLVEATYSYQKEKNMRDADGIIGPKTLALLTADMKLHNQ
jgi:murein L,D-transpeptidase YcbB/YkuD